MGSLGLNILGVAGLDVSCLAGLMEADTAVTSNGAPGRDLSYLRAAGCVPGDGQGIGGGMDLLVPCSAGLDVPCLVGLMEGSRTVAR